MQPERPNSPWRQLFPNGLIVRREPPRTFLQYLRFMPLGPLLLTIALAIAVRIGTAALLMRYEPGLSLVVNYLLSLIPALSTALALTYAFWRRSQHSRPQP